MGDVNIGIFTADLNSGNMGCNALTYSALLLMEEVATKLDKKFSYTLFTRNQEECLLNYDHLNGVDIQMVEPIPRTRDAVKKLLKRDFKSLGRFNVAVDGCDVFFEIAGGDSYSDIYGISRPIIFDRCHSKVMKKGAPLIFLPQTIGPFKSGKAREIAKKGLSYAAHIFARDPISFAKAKEVSGTEAISQAIDMAFFMDYEKAHKSEGKPQIGINPSGLLWNGGYTGDNQFGLKSDYQSMLSTLIESIDVATYDIVLVPHVLSGPQYHIEDDYKVCKWLKKKYPFCKVAPFFYAPMEAKSFISGLNLLIGSRMHCCIAAYSSGVPVYPLAYSRKFKGLFKEELKYTYGAELMSDDEGAIVAGLQDVLGKLENIQAEMPQRLEKVASYKDGIIETLETLISDHVAR